MKYVIPLLVCFLCLSLVSTKDNNQYESPPHFKINLDPNECLINIEKKLKISSSYKEKINKKKNKRTISINGIVNHNVGQFPNPGNPNIIEKFNMSFSIPLIPEIAKEKTNGRGYDTGVFFSGASIEPYTAEFFIGPTGERNRKWNITTLTNSINLGLDCNNAHVQPTGKYHYHGTPSAYLQKLGVDGTEMIKIGYAADGFPIYYKFGYNADGMIKEYKSGYTLKRGRRPGDGKNAPDGLYDGTYFNDYEYIDTLSELDECNGKWGKTPESDNEYYYVVTDNFPSVPLCFSGTPSNDLKKQRGNGRPPHGRRPPHGMPPPREGPPGGQPPFRQ